MPKKQPGAWLQPGEVGSTLGRTGLQLVGGVYLSGFLNYECPVQIGGCALLETTLGAYTYIGQNARIHYTRFGRYCSVADYVTTSPGDHPTDLISTSPAVYSDFFNWHKPVEFAEEWNGHDPVEVGNDVWLCANAVIVGGVKIGDGAVVAAGAIVTKDVEPYTIVGGVPARTLRRRFSDEIVQRLTTLMPWNYDLPQLYQSTGFAINKAMSPEHLNLLERHIGEGRAERLNPTQRTLKPLQNRQWHLSANEGEL